MNRPATVSEAHCSLPYQNCDIESRAFRLSPVEETPNRPRLCPDKNAIAASALSNTRTNSTSPTTRALGGGKVQPDRRSGHTFLPEGPSAEPGLVMRATP